MRNGIFAAGIPCVAGERLMRLILRRTNCKFVSDPLSQTSLLPNQAVSLLNERVRQIAKINADIADWLLVCNPCVNDKIVSVLIHEQERRKVEELYVQGLKRVAVRRQQDGASDLGYR